jgi:glutamine synthetase
VDLVEDLRQRGVNVLRLAYSDLNGIQRGKDVPLSEAEAALAHGKPFVEAVMTIDMRHTVLSGEEHGFRDIVAIPDPSTLRITPLEPDTAVVLCDLTDSHGDPQPLDPRGALRRAIGRLAERGAHPVLASELEFYLLERTGREAGALQAMPMRDSSVYTVGPLADPTGIVRRMLDAAADFDLRPVSYSQEYGHCQYEINLAHGEALESSDRAFLFKSLVKQIAAREGLVATFIGLPFENDEASGLHLHTSLVDADGANLFDDPSAEDGLSALARQFAAGVVAHGPALSGILNPTVNAYKRIAVGGLSPKFANWGHDNRLAMLRFCHERGPATRFEIRSGDGSANPYLAAAAMLAAGLDGIERGLELPPPVVGNPYEGPEELLGPPLPSSLAEGLDALEADETLVAALGERLVGTFVRNKRTEVERWQVELNKVTAWELAEYAEQL